MGRRPRVATEEGVAPVVRRRRPRAVDHVAQTQLLLEALLRQRGERGTTWQEAFAVVSWARGVHNEETELKQLVKRVRLAKSEGVAERQQAHMVNKTLLDGVLAGSLFVDVSETGELLFGPAGT